MKKQTKKYIALLLATAVLMIGNSLMAQNEKENNIDEHINNTAKVLLEQNERYIGKDIKNLAIKKLENTEEGGSENGKKTRGRRKTTAI